MARLDFQSDKANSDSLDFQPMRSKKTSLQEWGGNHPFLGRVAATLAQGGANFGNTLGQLVPGLNENNTNYFNEYGVKPNMATEIGTALLETAPAVAFPEAIISNAGRAIAGPGVYSFLSRLGIRGASGAAENEGRSRAMGDEPSAGGDLAHAGIYGATGAVADILPYKAAKLVDKMQGTRLSDDMIAEGNRLNLFPDIGDMVGSPAGAGKWKDTVRSLFSPGKEVQETFNNNLQRNKFSNLEHADNEALSLQNRLEGDGYLPEKLSQGITDHYNLMRKQGNEIYNALDPYIEKEIISSHPNAAKAAQAILDEQKQNLSLGVGNESIENNILGRAKNAVSMEGKEKFPLSSKITEERNLSTRAADLRAAGDNSSARYYSDLAKAHQADIEAHLKNNPELNQKIKEARDFYKNNVIPYRESPTVRKVVNNNFDEEFTPLTLSNNLTNGSNNQLLSILPQETKNQILSDILFRKSGNALGEKFHPSIDLAKSIGSKESRRLSPLLENNPEKESLSKISKTANLNKDVLKGLSKETKTISGENPIAGGIASAVEPGGVVDFLKNALSSPNSGYWTNLLSNEKNPALIGKIMSGEKITANDIKSMNQARDKALMEVLNPLNAITNIGSRPNFLRLPVETGINALNQKEMK